MTKISGRHCSSQGCTKEDPLYTTSTSTNTQGPLIFKRPGGKKTVYTKCIYIYVYICVYIHMLCKIDVYFTACKSCVQNLFRLFLAHFFPARGTIHLCFLLIHIVHVLLFQVIHIHLAFIKKKPLVGVSGWKMSKNHESKISK